MSNLFSRLSPNNKAIFILFFVSAFEAIYNMLLPIYLDEAYYWVWAITPDWSYYDHPGMIAWIIYPFTLLGNDIFLIRLPSVICISVAIYYLFKLTYEVAGNDEAWIVLVILMVIPVVQLGYTIITPDSPLILFWSMAMYYIYKAFSTSKTKYFIIGGIVTGLAMLSKYTAILFPVSVLIFILVKRRDLLKDYRLWISVIIAALLTFPIFYWNIQHDWISILFQYEHGTSDGFKILFDEFIILIFGSLLIPTPILAIILICYIFTPKEWTKDQNKLYLIILTLFPLLFFYYKGLFKKMELNWIIIAFLSGSILIGIAAVKFNMKRSLKYGIILAVILSVILKLSPFLPLPPKLNFADRLLGYEEACQYLDNIITDNESVFTDHLTMASMLRYYLKDHRRVYIPVNSRFSQYTIWDNTDKLNYKSMNAIYLGSSDRYDELKDICNQVRLIEKLEIKPLNATSKIFFVYSCTNF